MSCLVVPKYFQLKRANLGGLSHQLLFPPNLGEHPVTWRQILDSSSLDLIKGIINQDIRPEKQHVIRRIMQNSSACSPCFEHQVFKQKLAKIQRKEYQFCGKKGNCHSRGNPLSPFRAGLLSFGLVAFGAGHAAGEGWHCSLTSLMSKTRGHQVSGGPVPLPHQLLGTHMVLNHGDSGAWEEDSVTRLSPPQTMVLTLEAHFRGEQINNHAQLKKYGKLGQRLDFEKQTRHC